MASNLRRWMHFLAAGLLYYSGLLAAWRFFRTRFLRKDQVCVLGFHRVLAKEEQAASNSLPGMVMSEPTFAKLLEHVRRRFRVIDLEDLETADGDSLRPGCLITFDDGWRDNYTRAYPWLRKYNVPATVFLVAGLIGGEGSFWVEGLVGAWKDPSRRERICSLAARILNGRGLLMNLENLVEYLKRLPARERQETLRQLLPEGAERIDSHPVDQMLSWDEVMEMSRGGIEFGLHTMTHPLLTYETDSTVDRELALGTQILQEKLGQKARAFAYPNGDWDDRVRRRVKEAGYGCAFTTEHGWHRRGQDPYTIRRILLHEGNVTGPDGEFSPAMFNFTLARSR